MCCAPVVDEKARITLRDAACEGYTKRNEEDEQTDGCQAAGNAFETSFFFGAGELRINLGALLVVLPGRR